jgi:hypothetical protein
LPATPDAISAAAVLLALACLGAPAQDAPAPAHPADAPAETLAASAETFVPGQLPASTAPAARQAWEALLAAVLPAGDPAPVEAFDLRFDARIASGERQTNDVSGRYRFRAPGYVRTLLEESGRETMRGPDGDWLVFKNGRKVPLEGRDYELDVEELDRAINVAQTFCALTDPRTLRIARLELLPAPPSTIPDSLAPRAAELQWLLLETPDLAPASADAAARPAGALQRLELGLDRAQRLPSLAVVRPSELGPEAVESAQLLDLQNFKPLDGFRVPHTVLTYRPDLTTSPWSFDLRRQSSDLYILGGTLRPTLAPADFRPPEEPGR